MHAGPIHAEYNGLAVHHLDHSTISITHTNNITKTIQVSNITKTILINRMSGWCMITLYLVVDERDIAS